MSEEIVTACISITTYAVENFFTSMCWPMFPEVFRMTKRLCATRIGARMSIGHGHVFSSVYDSEMRTDMVY
jgi:hypothetical protein